MGLSLYEHLLVSTNMHRGSILGRSDLCAIFVHAGAGYHSQTNEKNHLKACNDAAKVGMAVLKNGGNAVEAVEMAIRLLEDRDITNAGFGSNLTMEGIVECDACIVDHFGRSGAVGAITREYLLNSSLHHPGLTSSQRYGTQLQLQELFSRPASSLYLWQEFLPVSLWETVLSNLPHHKWLISFP